jgi:hypothetical protein
MKLNHIQKKTQEAALVLVKRYADGFPIEELAKSIVDLNLSQTMTCYIVLKLAASMSDYDEQRLRKQFLENLK